jgi:hypothetical protein
MQSADHLDIGHHAASIDLSGEPESGVQPAGVPVCNINTVTVSDNCSGPVMLNCRATEVTNDCAIVRTLNYQAIDGCSNTGTWSRTITWTQDTTLLLLTCLANTNLGYNPVSIPGCNTNEVKVGDNCGGPVTLNCSAVETTSGCVVTRTLNYWGIDSCGNTGTCSRLINWTVCVPPPVLTCLANTNLGCNPIHHIGLIIGVEPTGTAT